MKTLKIIAAIIAAVPATLIVSAILLFIIVPLINNSVAASIRRDLENLPLPAQTELIDSLSAAGNLVSQGNKVQTFGAILVRSELSLEELSAHFSQYRIDNEWHIQVEMQYSRNIGFMRERERFTFNLSTDAPLENYFIVYAWGPTNGVLDGLFDLRGN